MERLHPFARLTCALSLIAATFLCRDLADAMVVYAVILLAIVIAGTAREHLRFIGLIALPLLIALLVVWGWANNPSHLPPPYKSGVLYAFANWLKIISCGAVFQWLLIPLVAHPRQLRGFLAKTGMSGSLGTLIVASIVFLPEVQRRLGRLIDARKVQGYSTAGLRGLLNLPALLMPLVSSLLDSATRRAELWSHRGLLERQYGSHSSTDYALGQSVLATAVAIGTVAIAFTP